MSDGQMTATVAGVTGGAVYLSTTPSPETVPSPGKEMPLSGISCNGMIRRDASLPCLWRAATAEASGSARTAAVLLPVQLPSRGLPASASALARRGHLGRVGHPPDEPARAAARAGCSRPVRLSPYSHSVGVPLPMGGQASTILASPATSSSVTSTSMRFTPRPGADGTLVGDSTPRWASVRERSSTVP